MKRTIRWISALAAAGLFLATSAPPAGGQGRPQVDDKQRILLSDADWDCTTLPPDMWSIPTGNVGIGTMSPGAKLDVSGSEGEAIRASNPSLTGRWIQMLYDGSAGPLLQGGIGYDRLTLDAREGATGKIVLGRGGDRVGVGVLNPVGRFHVDSTASPYSTYAGHFTLDYPDETGVHVVHAEYTGTDNMYDPVAVYGKSAPEAASGIGGYFEGGLFGAYGQVWPTTIGNYYGTLGNVNGGDGTNYGVHGGAYDGHTNYGVYGIAGGGDVNYAGYFAGDLHATGNITSDGVKSFRIDHPLDPQNKYLHHYCIESNEVSNVYTGNAVLDDTGEAQVQMPAWFEAVNRDFRYQLTCIGGHADVFVAEEIADNGFRIAGGEPGLKVSWQVTGIRHDPAAEASVLPVESDKPGR